MSFFGRLSIKKEKISRQNCSEHLISYLRLNRRYVPWYCISIFQKIQTRPEVCHSNPCRMRDSRVQLLKCMWIAGESRVMVSDVSWASYRYFLDLVVFSIRVISSIPISISCFVWGLRAVIKCASRISAASSIMIISQASLCTKRLYFAAPVVVMPITALYCVSSKSSANSSSFSSRIFWLKNNKHNIAR